MIKIKVLSVVGARPQFIKQALFSAAIREHATEVLVHTGQHYDQNMSDDFFSELSIPKPNYNLNIGSDPDAVAVMLQAILDVLQKENPDVVVVWGDTNSTLAAALAASKKEIPVVHVEAGMRSYDRSMPEEVNRVSTDHISSLLLCSTHIAAENLAKEGISEGVFVVGDIMVELLEKVRDSNDSDILKRLDLDANSYCIATVHRAGNVDDKQKLTAIVGGLVQSAEKIVLPLHPRTKKRLAEFDLLSKLDGSNITIIDPVPYKDLICLQQHAKKVITDSGGVQKEAYVLGKPCITLRENTEWVETVDDGWNVLVGAETDKIVDAIQNFSPDGKQTVQYTDGSVVEKIVQRILELKK